jgi:hypothetical protein
MNIHPAIWKQVAKMYRWLYKTDLQIKKVFESHNIEIDEKIGLNNLEDILNTLSYEQGIEIISGVLQVEDFWMTQNDIIRLRNSRRNRDLFGFIHNITQPLEYVPPEQRLFGEELQKLLNNFCGIDFDRQTNTLSFHNGGIRNIASVVNSNLLVKLKFEDYFLTIISQELNGVYRNGFYNSTLLLARKLFENLLINLLVHKYPKNKGGNFNMYYDKSRNRYKDLSDLIKVLREKKQDFLDGHSTIQRFITKIEKLADMTNPTAHKLTYNASREDVSSLGIEELLELFKKIAEAISLNGIFK